MKAFQLISNGKAALTEVPLPEPGPGQARVKIKAAALNKRDQFICEGKYPNIEIPAILGSDGAGVVDAVGEGVDASWLNKEVVINPNQGWGDNPLVQHRNYTILGMPSDGTLAEYVVVDDHRLYLKPTHLSFHEAAALPLAGLTAYRACFHHGKIQEGENVLISGYGGGVAQLAFQFAWEIGAEVYVTSGSKEKRAHATSHGAAGAFDYTNPAWHKNIWNTKGGFDVVIDSAGGDQINQFIKMMRPAGRIVFYGATNGLPSSLDLYRMFWNQVTLQGSTMGNDTEFEQMLNFVSDKKITPVVDSVRPLDEISSALNAMSTNIKIGKIVIEP